MTTIGFDVSKHELVGVRVNRRAQVQNSFVLENTPASVAAFLDGLLRDHGDLSIASEATAEYHRVLAEECLRRHIPFRLLNPITTKQFTRATVRKRKTDLSDALVIAKLALQGEGTLVSAASLSPVKPFSRTATKLIQMAQMLTLMQQRFDAFLPGDAALREYFEAPKRALEASAKALRERVRVASDPRLLALLASLPGIGTTTAAILLSEIADIERFPNGKSLVAYAGLDPRVRQSGLTLKRNTRLTKRGSPYLRHALYVSAGIAVRHDRELRRYYEKKRGEGKRYKEAVVATARKLLYRVYAIWKRGTPYQDYPQANA